MAAHLVIFERTRPRNMSGVDTRNISRDSLFLLADLRVANENVPHRVKVRNLSAGGMMAEGPVEVSGGMKISINLRNIGWVDGNVAWVQDGRFGIAFARDIDPKLARASSAPADGPPRYTKPSSILPPSAMEQDRLRKI